MTTTSTQTNFTGPYKEQLTQLAELIEWLESEHGKSWVRAGDDRVYCYGGCGHIIVFDQSKWEGLIELETPDGSVTIKPGEGGQLEAASEGKDEAAIRKMIEDCIEGINSYYENRYWSTP